MDESARTAFGSAPSSEPPFEPYTMAPAVEQVLERYLGERAQLQLSETWQARFVRFVPWIMLAFVPFYLVAVVVLLSLSGLGALLGVSGFSHVLLPLAVTALSIASLRGLFARSRQGWARYVYALALTALSSALNLSPLGLLVNALALWFAFQVKYRYH